MPRPADFHTIEVDSLGCLTTFAQNKSKDKEDWIFRGLRDASWLLETSLERFCKQQDILLTNAHIVERALVSEFKRRFHQYSSYVPAADNLEWLSIMRHYGAPTRLLDWAYSIEVATYFALEGQREEKACVWAVNKSWAQKESASQLYPVDPDAGNWLTDQPSAPQNAERFREAFLESSRAPCACPLAPYRLTQRLTVQKGIFVCPSDVTLPFTDNVTAFSGWDDEKHIRRFEIPSRVRIEILRHLYDANISRTTLFPDLEGFAQSMGVYHHWCEASRIEKSPFTDAAGGDAVWD